MAAAGTAQAEERAMSGEREVEGPAPERDGTAPTETGRIGKGDKAGLPRPDDGTKRNRKRDPEKPLLIDTIPGEEERAPELERVGHAMLFIGSVMPLLYIGLNILSAPALSRGWDGVWFRPGSQFDFVPVLSLMLIIAGAIIYKVSRRVKSIADDDEPDD
jgi:hypothetical protein